jgi:CelD/BcsL family acetyltransferase involved in cellulose biosynthesis
LTPAPTHVQLVPVDEGLIAAWDDLAVQSEANVFARPGFILAWARAFGEGASVHALVGRRSGRVVSLLPVLRHGQRGLRTLTNTESPGCYVVAADAAAAASLLVSLPSGLRRLSLSLLPEDDLLYRAMHSGSFHRLRFASRQSRLSPWLSTSGDFESFERGRLDGDRRRKLMRNVRRLDREGRVEFAVHDGRDDLERLLQEGFDLEASGWKGRNRTAVLSRPAARRFYWEAAEWAAKGGLLRLSFLRLDGRAVAFSYGLENNGAWSVKKVGYDEAYRSYSPGLLHMRSSIMHAFASDSIQRYEFLGEAEAYKRMYAESFSGQVDVEVFTGGVTSELSRLAVESRWQVRERIASRLPLDVRTKIDVSSPRKFIGSVRRLVQQRVRPSDSRARLEG